MCFLERECKDLAMLSGGATRNGRSIGKEAPELKIIIKKKRDGTHTLTCVREDGTVTGQRQDDNGFFEQHDLTHYAVETTLSLDRAFFGLLASGWDIGDFGTPWPPGPIPPEAAGDASLAEGLAGNFDMERYCQIPVSAERFNREYGLVCAEAGISQRLVTESELNTIRQYWAELKALLDATPPGETLELAFPD